MITFFQKLFFCKKQRKLSKLACWQRFQLFQKLFYHWRNLILMVKIQNFDNFVRFVTRVFEKLVFFKKITKTNFNIEPPWFDQENAKYHDFFKFFRVFSSFFHFFAEPDNSGSIKNCLFLRRCLRKPLQKIIYFCKKLSFKNGCPDYLIRIQLYWLNNYELPWLCDRNNNIIITLMILWLKAW